MNNPPAALLFKDEDPNNWPGNEWPRFLEILRAFCLSDAEQDAYFPDLKEPYYHSAMGGDGYTLNSYDPPLADAYDLCAIYGGRGDSIYGEMLGRLSTLFYESVQQLPESADHAVFPYACHTNLAEFKILRPQLRALYSEALDFFGAEKRLPQMAWKEIAPQ